MAANEQNYPTPCDPLCSLYVGNLHPEVTEATLYEKFSEVGPILSIRICRDRQTQKSLCYGYLNFQKPEDAERALYTMNYDLVHCRTIRIMWSQRDPTFRKSATGNVFIKNLDSKIDDKAIYGIFANSGDILSCKVAVDENNHSKGYGFVQFKTEESATNAINKINGKLLNGKKVYVAKFIPREERSKVLENKTPKFKNVYIKNLADNIDDEELSKIFEKYGTIKSAKIMKDIHGKSKCFGFVCFGESEHAQEAVNGMNGAVLNGKILYVGRAQRKSERDEHMKTMLESKLSRCGKLVQ